MSVIQSPSFERWLEHAFDHPENDPKWHRRPDSEYWSGEPSLKAEYIARTFERGDEHLARFSDQQIEAGFWMIIGRGYVGAALGDEVPAEQRLRLVRSTYALFSRLFAARCRRLELGGDSPLYRICYMFWEIFPLENKPEHARDAALCEEKISAIERILGIDNPMCQYSALHGLGHAQLEVPERSAAIIDSWLVKHEKADPRLREYAQAARTGDVQ
ncbi:MAG: hypothetical protein HYV14_09855 [Elusimicrobia bacterium]|nr:hypothetical protein [Elusimicrobiota bacterium]